MAPTLKSQELSATMGAGVEARDRGPCVCGGGGAARLAGRKSPPIPAAFLAAIQKGPFSATVRAAQLGREGGGGRAGGRVGEPRSRAEL